MDRGTVNFWEQVAASALGFIPAAVIIYWLGFRAGRNKEEGTE